ncbi:MAG: MarC family protein [Gammaproteobacteria bacterium]
MRTWNILRGFALLTVLLGSAGPAMAAEAEGTLSLGLSKIFTFFFLTLGPKAVIAPFARSTATLDAGGRRKVALATTGISLVSIVIAATLGVRVLSNWGISTGALLIAAGIILFLIAMDSIREQYEPGDKPVASVNGDISVRRLAFRLAFPFVVSPYGVAVVILVLTSRPEFVPITPILAMLGGIMLLNLLAMLGANRIASSPYVAPAFAVVGAVLGVLQAALGIQAILVGLRFAGVVDAT